MIARAATPGTRSRQGLTLLELIVVIVILAALAGMVVPMLPNMHERAHTATGATNLSEVLKSLQTHEQFHSSYPTDFDALVDATGTLVDYLPGGNVGGQVSPLTLTSTRRIALFNAGITRLAAMHPTRAALDAAGLSSTFTPQTTPIDLATLTPTVAQVSELAVESTIVSDRDANTEGDVYVIVGIGSRCSMIGKSIGEAPVHFGESRGDSPSAVYGRYCAVFRVARGRGVANPAQDLTRAVLVGVVALHQAGIVGTNSHLQEYHDLQKSQ